MYDIPRYIEEQYITPPQEVPVTTCSYCGQDMFLGEDAWIIKDDVYCRCCIEEFQTEIEEQGREFDFED